MEKSSQSVVAEAETVYLLMPKNVPVTRASRLQWLLDHINVVISLTSEKVIYLMVLSQLHYTQQMLFQKSKDDLEILSIVPVGEVENCTGFLVTTSTNVVFLARSYRFVYCLDMSPSQSAVDIEKGEILFDQILHRFKLSLEGVCREVKR